MRAFTRVGEEPCGAAPMELIPSVFLNLSPRPAQRIQLTVQMRQALRILQMPVVELKSFLEEELVANPFLEEIERDYVPAEREREQDEEGRVKEVPAQEETSLHEHLLSQWNLLHLSDLQCCVGKAILEDLDESGYLVSSLSSIAEDFEVGISKAEEVLVLVQSLDPAGVACRSLSECLCIQIGRLDRENDRRKELMKQIVTNHLEDLMKMGWQRTEEVRAAVTAIRKLNPKPGRTFGTFRPHYVIPDVIFRPKRGGFEVLCNKKELPDLKIRSSYKKLLKDPRTSPEVRRYLREKLNSAIALLRALEKRGNTMERLAKCLAEEQTDFLRKGTPHLKPFQMGKLARRLGLHKSTVSRAVADKYAETPHGVVALRAFFDNAVGSEEKKYSSSTVKNKIRLLVEKESCGCPISDNEITLLLKRQGISIARRTVAKYRQALHLLPSYSRKP